MLAAMQLNGSSAIVTGGASGLGEATARVLAAAGAHVIIADLSTEAGEQVAAETGGQFVKTNVTAENDVLAALAAAESSGRPLRAVVNCAGIGYAARTVNRDGSPHELAGLARTGGTGSVHYAHSHGAEWNFRDRHRRRQRPG